MTSRQLFWMLPVSAVVLIGATLWEQSRRRGGDRPEVQVGTVQQSVGPELQFELYDSRNRTVRLSRYLGRHRVDVVFLATGASVNDDPVVKAVGQPSLSRVILVISQQLPQVIRRDLAGQPEGGVVVLSDAGGRMGQSPGAAARAWGAMDDGGKRSTGLAGTLLTGPGEWTGRSASQSRESFAESLLDQKSLGNRGNNPWSTRHRRKLATRAAGCRAAGWRVASWAWD
ncbi:MAG: hypothetical protein CM1200mP2_44480 [Planctomycetaceae bacterium]|nr:MAG: hypothetical protein CM1200mP2_44480 [Planctomycetaceae bacterium]